jgi:hypothetical protein
MDNHIARFVFAQREDDDPAEAIRNRCHYQAL